MYSFLNHYPIYYLNEETSFIIEGNYVWELCEGDKVDRYHLSDQLLDEKIKNWAHQFWYDLQNSPTYIGIDNHLGTEYYTVLGNQVVNWVELIIEQSKEITNVEHTLLFLQNPLHDEEIKIWLKEQVENK